MALPSFTIYALGDTTSFWTMLNSVAMFFSDRGLFESAALLGSLIAIIYFIMSLIPGGNVTSNPIAAFVGLGITFTLATIPTSVVVQNIYTGSIVKVDNIPAIISIPASAFTKAAYNLFNTSETVFQSTDGRYQTVKDNGFTAPLKLLFALRKGLPQEAPLLALNIKTFAKDCITNSDTFQGEMSKAQNALTYMLDHGNPTSLTMDYPAGSSDPVGTNCAAQATVLKARAAAFLAGDLTYGDVNAIINQNMTKMSTAKPTANQPYTLGDSQQQVNVIIAQNLNGAIQDQRDIMSNLITYDVLKNGMACSGVGADAQKANSCWLEEASARQAEEQWKADAAAAGSMFTKLMRPAIQFFQLMFFAFSPFAIIAALLMAGRSLGMIVKYLMFGAWTISWLPFTSVIQMYIQNEVSAQIATIAKPAVNGVGGITMANTPAFYEMLSVNLALASDLLAAVPLFSFAILTGGAMAMTSLAERMSTRDKFDEKLASPSQVAADPTLKIQGATELGRTTGGDTDYKMPTMSLSTSSSSTASSSLAKVDMASDTLNSGYSALRDKSESRGSSAFKDEASRLEYNDAYDKSKQSTNKMAQQINESLKIGKDKSVNMANQLALGLGGAASILKANATASGIATDSETMAKAEAFDKTYGTEIAKMRSERQTLSAAAAKSKGYKETTDIKDGYGESVSLSKAEANVNSTSKNFTTQSATGFTGTLSESMPVDSLGKKLLENSSSSQLLQTIIADAKQQGFDDDFVNRMKMTRDNMVAHNVPMGSAEASSALVVLQAAAGNENNPNQQLAQQQLNKFADALNAGGGVQKNPNQNANLVGSNSDGRIDQDSVEQAKKDAVKVGASDGRVDAVGSNKNAFSSVPLNFTNSEIQAVNKLAAKEKVDAGIASPETTLSSSAKGAAMLKEYNAFDSTAVRDRKAREAVVETAKDYVEFVSKDDPFLDRVNNGLPKGGETFAENVMKNNPLLPQSPSGASGTWEAGSQNNNPLLPSTTGASGTWETGAKLGQPSNEVSVKTGSTTGYSSKGGSSYSGGNFVAATGSSDNENTNQQPSATPQQMGGNDIKPSANNK